MDSVGLHGENLYRHACETQKALGDLYVELHYLACEGGVYRERRK
jgi:hypothetical protein